VPAPSKLRCRVYARKDAHRPAARIYARAATVFTNLLKMSTHFTKLLELFFSSFAKKIKNSKSLWQTVGVAQEVRPRLVR
jgi:hypothetical protein